MKHAGHFLMLFSCLLAACSVRERTAHVYDKVYDTHDIWLEPQLCDPSTHRLTCFSIRLRTTPEHSIDVLIDESSYRGPDGEVSALRLLRKKELEVMPDAHLSIMKVLFVPARWYPDSHFPAELPQPLMKLPHAPQTIAIAYTVDGKRLTETFEFDLHWTLQGPAPCMWQC